MHSNDPQRPDNTHRGAPPAAADPLAAHRDAGVVLVVDDVPDNLSLLHDALDDAGYTVLVATSGQAALQRVQQAEPHIVLLDAVMPGMDGYEVARRLKADPASAHIPIIFMTGLADTEHVLAAFEAGCADYVTKPIRPAEVMARMAVHRRAARQARQARNALDAYGHATLAVRLDPSAPAGARLVWQTPLARQWLPVYFDAPLEVLPLRLIEWLQELAAGVHERSLQATAAGRRLVVSLQGRTVDDDWLLVLREVNDAAVVEATMQAFGLTLKESEVLYWVARGKTNRDIGDILGSSPATVKKHLEHVFAKLGVETRTAAASLAMQRVRGLQPA
jgi:CheY-like chemotaxis protein/DNA-binding CsgD family transcriptional regulator